MNRHDLTDFLGRLKSPVPNAERQKEARQNAVAAFREQTKSAESTAVSRHARKPNVFIRFPGFAAGLAAGLAIAAGLWFWSPSQPPEVAQSPFGTLEDELRILAEVERLFPGQLAAIVFGREGERLLLSQESVSNDQAVVLDLRRNGEWLRILTYNGNRITTELDGKELTFDVLITGEGEVILAGSDFVWTLRRSGEIAGFTVAAYQAKRS